MRERERDTDCRSVRRAVLCGRMLGACPSMLEVFLLMERAAECDAGVVIVGECGTGRELAARTIHERSARRGGPFVSIDAEAFEPERLELELLGRSGTASPHGGGALLQADGGSLLLGGLGRTTPGFQERLLAYLRSGCFQRSVGGGHVDADVRVMATSERSLEADVESGCLRSDLFYALAVLTIGLPPLRERRGDVPHLALHILRDLAGDGASGIEGFTRGAVSAMVSYDWPGNVSEMENRIRRAAIVAEGGRIAEADLGLDVPDERSETTLREALDRLTKEMVEDSLRRTLGNVSRAARSIGVSRPAMYDMIRKHDIDVRRFKHERTARRRRSPDTQPSAGQRAGSTGGSLDTPAPMDLKSGRTDAQE